MIFKKYSRSFLKGFFTVLFRILFVLKRSLVFSLFCDYYFWIEKREVVVTFTVIFRIGEWVYL